MERNQLSVLLVTTLLSAISSMSPASADMSNAAIKIGVLNDMSSLFSTNSGMGSVAAVQMAADDIGGKINGVPIQIVYADHQNKADVGSAVARSWFTRDNVDAIVDVPVSSVALAVQDIGRQNKKIIMFEALSSQLTGEQCSPYSTVWADDTYALSSALIRAVVPEGGKTWFFITSDYAFGHALQKDATNQIAALGGSVTGSVEHPLNTPDMSSYLLQAKASGAQVVAMANAGADTWNAVKQANEFGIISGGQKIATFLMFEEDVFSLGLPITQGLLAPNGFYWDQSPESREFARRFMAKVGRMPSKEQGEVYLSATHYFKAVARANTDDADKVIAAMREIPVDYFGEKATIREDGRVMYPMTLYQVKTPAESKGQYDIFKPLKVIPADEAFRPLKDGGCPYLKK